jgi:drug/metabolite transporter (DMT)-like permease
MCDNELMRDESTALLEPVSNQGVNVRNSSGSSPVLNSKTTLQSAEVIKPSERRLWIAVAVWCLLSLIWGTTWMFIKVGLRDLPPFSFAGIRFVIAACILVVIAVVRRPALPSSRRDWMLIGMTGLLTFTVNYGLLFWGEQHTSSGLAAILQAIIPVFGLALAHLYLPGERMTAGKVLGVALGLAGVLVVFSNQLSSGEPSGVWGCAAILVGAFAAAYSNVLVKARGGHLDLSILAAGQMIFGLVPLLLTGAILEGNPFSFHWSVQAFFSVFYLAIVGSAAAFMMFYWLVRNMDVTKTMLISLVTPLMAVLLGMVILDEQLNWRVVIGGAGILAGIGVVIFQKAKSATIQSQAAVELTS